MAQSDTEHWAVKSLTLEANTLLSGPVQCPRARMEDKQGAGMPKKMDFTDVNPLPSKGPVMFVFEKHNPGSGRERAGYCSS